MVSEYASRRAKNGYGALKRELLEELWQVDNMITHYIIMGQAGDKGEEVKKKRADAETRRAVIITELESFLH